MRQQYSHPTGTEHVTLGFRFRRAKPWPHLISRSWHTPPPPQHLPRPVVPINDLRHHHPHRPIPSTSRSVFGLAGQNPGPARSPVPGVPPPPPLHLPHLIAPINDPHPWHPHSTDTECDALSFRFGRAKHRPRPVFHSWRSTTTTTAFSSPHGLYKRFLTTTSTPDQYRSRRTRLLVWQGTTLAPARARYPGISPPQTAHKNRPTYSLYAPAIHVRCPSGTECVRSVFASRGQNHPPLPDLCIPASHHLKPRISISRHTPSATPALKFQLPGREGRNILRVWKGGEGGGDAGEEGGVVAWEWVFHEAVCGLLCCRRSNERVYDRSVLPNEIYCTKLIFVSSLQHLSSAQALTSSPTPPPSRSTSPPP